MHKSFFPLFVVSVLGVIGSSWLRNTTGFLEWTGLIAGLTPLVIYHGILLSRRSLSPAEVDSIYYFGFLVTVVTLVSTAVSIGLAREMVQMHWVLLQFGLGLVATGYALFARLQLLSKSSASVELDLLDATEKLVASVQKITDEYDKAGYQVTAFTNQTERRLSEIAQRMDANYAGAEAKFERKLADASVAFNENLTKLASESLERCRSVIDDATAKFSAGMSLVIEEVGRVRMEAQEISFTKAAERIEHFTKEMETSIGSMASKVADASNKSAGAISALVTTAAKAQQLATGISASLANLDRLTALIGTISSASDALANVSKSAAATDGALTALALNADQVRQQVQTNIVVPLTSAEIGEHISSVGAALPAVVSRLLQSLEALGSQATNFAALLHESRGNLERSISSAAAGLGSVEARLAPLNELGANLRAAVNQLQSTALAIQSLLRPSALPENRQTSQPAPSPASEAKRPFWRRF